MESERTHIEDLPGVLADADVGVTGSWAAAVTGPWETWILTPGGRFRAMRKCRHPLVRLLEDESVVLVDRREKPRGSPNAWWYGRGGNLVAQWCVGDCIADVLCFEGCIAVTYIDQAFGDDRGFDGVSIFNGLGVLVAQYNRFGSKTVVDCYCATRCGARKLAFLVYPGFALVELDLDALTEECWEAPAAVCGASGLTSWRGDYVFHGSYSNRTALVGWTPGEPDGIAVGSYEGTLRGLGNGRFLAVQADGFTVLTVS